MCITDLTNPKEVGMLETIPMESVIPIQNTYYAILHLANEGIKTPENLYK